MTTTITEPIPVVVSATFGDHKNQDTVVVTDAVRSAFASGDEDSVIAVSAEALGCPHYAPLNASASVELQAKVSNDASGIIHTYENSEGSTLRYHVIVATMRVDHMRKRQ